MLKIIEEIAAKYFRISTLDTRMSDSLDFYNCAVWSIKAALEAAYKAGENNAWLESTNRRFPDFGAAD